MNGKGINMFGLFNSYKYKVGERILTVNNEVGVIEARRVNRKYENRNMPQYLIKITKDGYSSEIKWTDSTAIVSKVSEEVELYLKKIKAKEEFLNKQLNRMTEEFNSLEKEIALLKQTYKNDYKDGDKVILLCHEESEWSNYIGKEFYVGKIPSEFPDYRPPAKSGATNYLMENPTIKKNIFIIPVQPYQIKPVSEGKKE